VKYELLNPIDPDNTAIETVLLNRGILKEDIHHYLNTTDEDIYDFNLLGKDALMRAGFILMDAIENKENCLIVIDADCDGFTSAALMANYLYDIEPEWVENHVTYFMHAGKQHGLADVVVEDGVSLVLMPDAGSNDYEQHEALKDRGIDVIILDHHEAEYLSPHAVVINNQLSNYPNKELSGVGVTWQFCRFLDSQNGTSYADQYIDLVALGLDADMMSLKSIETKHLINKGLEKARVRNPFFYGLSEKNSYSIGSELTPIGVAFYIAPFVNAMTRSGTQDEKMLLFNSMLKHEAFKIVPSTKRGKKVGDTERIVDQALRVVTNVKSRQKKSQDGGMDLLESLIETKNLLDNKVLLFQCESGTVGKNIAGLVANKFMSKYQRNTAILFRRTEPDGRVSWQGSARGYSKSDIASFKDLCEETGKVIYAQGHAGAFGLGIWDEDIEDFIAISNKMLEQDSGEAVYHVDYDFDNGNVNATNVLDIARLKNLWGQDMPEALIAIKNLKVTKDNLVLMSPDKKPTLKITLPNGVSLIKFGSSQKEYEKFYSETGYVEVNIVGTCSANEWMGNVTPQILIKDFEIVDSNKYYF
jgi:single-stranded-DNA-specific exonuclease